MELIPKDDDERPQLVLGPLISLRIIWFAMLLGEVVFLFVTMTILHQRQPAPQPGIHKQFFIIDAVMLAAALPLAIFLRRTIQKPTATGKAPPQKYAVGTIVFMALCEGPAFFGLVNVVVTGILWPGLIVPIIAMGAQAMIFPTASKMSGN